MKIEWQLTQNFEDLPQEVFVFGSRKYLEALKKAFSTIYIVYGEWTENEQLHKAWLPLFSHKQGPFKRAVTPLLTPYSGLICSSKNIPIGSLNAFLKKNFHFNSHQLIDFESQPNYLDRTTCVWDYSEEFEPNKSLRKKLKKAESLNLEIENNADLKLLSKLYVEKINSRGAQLPYDQDSMFTFLSELNKAGLLEKHQISYQNQIVFSSATLVDPSTKFAYIMSTATTPGFEKFPSHHLLNHYFLTQNTLGWKLIDHCGTEIDSIAKFKRIFSNKEITYPGLQFWSSKSSELCYNALKKIKACF
jgi:hypothetical protein